VVRSDDGSLLSDSSSMISYADNYDVVKIVGLSEKLQNASNVSKDNTRLKVFSCNPFSLEDFRPDLAAIAINYLAFTIYQSEEMDISKKSAEWRLDINGYEKLDKQAQETFEYNTQKYSWINIKGLSVNNQSVAIQKYRWAKNVIIIVHLFTSAVFYMLVINTLKLLGVQLPINPSEKYSFGNFVFYLLFFYFWSLIYLALGKLFFKNLIPYPIYEEIFVKFSISPQNLFRLLQQKIVSKSNDV
jgi:hypothetical protein